MNEKRLICHWCFSSDRKLFPIGDIKVLLRNLNVATKETGAICWECKSYLESFSKFQSQVVQAQDTLENCEKPQDLKTLSTLTLSKVQTIEISSVGAQNASDFENETFLVYSFVKERSSEHNTDKSMSTDQLSQNNVVDNQKDVCDDSKPGHKAVESAIPTVAPPKKTGELLSPNGIPETVNVHQEPKNVISSSSLTNEDVIDGNWPKITMVQSINYEEMDSHRSFDDYHDLIQLNIPIPCILVDDDDNDAGILVTHDDDVEINPAEKKKKDEENIEAVNLRDFDNIKESQKAIDNKEAKSKQNPEKNEARNSHIFVNTESIGSQGFHSNEARKSTESNLSEVIEIEDVFRAINIKQERSDETFGSPNSSNNIHPKAEPSLDDSREFSVEVKAEPLSLDERAAVREQQLWKKSVLLVYNRIRHHKYASRFLRPITDEIAPEYSTVVKKPIDLNTIRRKIHNGVIRTTEEFQRDLMLMLTNAMMYNSSEHVVYDMAKDLFEEVQYQLGLLQNVHASSIYVSDTPAPRPKRHLPTVNRNEPEPKRPRLSTTPAFKGTTVNGEKTMGNAAKVGRKSTKVDKVHDSNVNNEIGKVKNRRKSCAAFKGGETFTDVDKSKNFNVNNDALKVHTRRKSCFAFKACKTSTPKVDVKKIDGSNVKNGVGKVHTRRKSCAASKVGDTSSIREHVIKINDSDVKSSVAKVSARRKSSAVPKVQKTSSLKVKIEKTNLSDVAAKMGSRRNSKAVKIVDDFTRDKTIVRDNVAKVSRRKSTVENITKKSTMHRIKVEQPECPDEGIPGKRKARTKSVKNNPASNTNKPKGLTNNQNKTTDTIFKRPNPVSIKKKKKTPKNTQLDDILQTVTTCFQEMSSDDEDADARHNLELNLSERKKLQRVNAESQIPVFLIPKSSKSVPKNKASSNQALLTPKLEPCDAAAKTRRPSQPRKTNKPKRFQTEEDIVKPEWNPKDIPKRRRTKNNIDNAIQTAPTPEKELKMLPKKAYGKTKKTKKLIGVESLAPNPFSLSAKRSIKNVANPDSPDTCLATAITTEPMRDLTRDEASLIKLTLQDRILGISLKPNSFAPKFRGKPVIADGVVKLWCEDQPTLQWLANIVASIKKIPDLVVRMQSELPKKLKCAILIPGNEDLEVVKRLLNAQNPWALVHSWHFHSIEQRGENMFLVIGIPNTVLPTLVAREQRLAYSLGSVDIHFFEEDGGLCNLPP